MLDLATQLGPAPLVMAPETFALFRDLVYASSGIALGDTKKALLCARLASRLAALGLGDYDSYLRFVRDDRSGDELVALLNAVSTNVTSFFREPAHFELLAEHVASCIAAGQRRFRFWSAACSSGPEPYSMAMTALDAAAYKPVDLRILATDLCTSVLAAAERGRYSPDHLDTVDARMRDRYFRRVRTGVAEELEARPRLRRVVTFKRLNLSAPPLPMRGPFDVIFCRNVMIYFDERVRRRLLEEIRRLLRPGGYLIVGHAESLSAWRDGFRNLRPSVYVRQS